MDRSLTIAFIYALAGAGMILAATGCSQLPRTFGDRCLNDADCGTDLHCSSRAGVCTMSCDPYEDQIGSECPGSGCSSSNEDRCQTDPTCADDDCVFETAECSTSCLEEFGECTSDGACAQ